MKFIFKLVYITFMVWPQSFFGWGKENGEQTVALIMKLQEK